MHGRCCSEVDGPAHIHASLDCRQSELAHGRCCSEVDRPVHIICVSLDCGQNTCIESVAMRWTGLLTFILCVSGLWSELLHRKCCNEVDRPAHTCVSLDWSQNLCIESVAMRWTGLLTFVSLDWSQNFCTVSVAMRWTGLLAFVCLDWSHNFCTELESAAMRWTGLLTFMYIWTGV